MNVAMRTGYASLISRVMCIHLESRSEPALAAVSLCFFPVMSQVRHAFSGQVSTLCFTRAGESEPNTACVQPNQGST